MEDSNNATDSKFLCLGFGRVFTSYNIFVWVNDLFQKMFFLVY